MRAFRLLLIACIALFLPGVTALAGITKTCPHCSWSQNFPSSDSSYAESMKQKHISMTHGSGGGSTGGHSGGYTGDFEFDVSMMLMQNFVQGFQQGVEQNRQRQEALRRQQILEQQRRAEEERLRREREAREAREREQVRKRRRSALDRTMDAELKKLDIDTELTLKLDDSDGDGLQLKGLEDDLQPAGTSFFGTGGGDGAYTDAMRADILRYRNATYLATAASGAGAKDQEFLIDEAVRAGNGDSSFIEAPPQDAKIAISEAGLISFQESKAHYREIQQNLEMARKQHLHAGYRLDVAHEAGRRAKAALAKLEASGADPALIEEKRKQLAAIEAAIVLGEEALKLSQEAVAIAEDFEKLFRWGQRQEIAALGGRKWQGIPKDLNAATSRIAKHYNRPYIDVPPPVILGAIRRADVGDKAFRRIQEFEAAISKLPPEQQVEAQALIVGMKKKAELLDYYDQVINARTNERVEAFKDLTVLRKDSKKRMDDFLSEALGTFGGSVADFRKAGASLLKDPAFQAMNEALGMEEAMQDATKIHEEINILRAAQASGDIDLEDVSKLSERAGKLSQIVAKNSAAFEATLGAAEFNRIFSVTSANPNSALVRKYGAVESERMLGRVGFLVSAGAGLARMTDQTMDILDMHQATSQINDELGDAAIHLKKVQKIHGKQVDEFKARSQTLQDLLSRS